MQLIKELFVLKMVAEILPS